MTVLADHELLALGEDLIRPFDPAMVQPASIDLRLGNEFIVFERDQTIAVDLDDVPKDLGKKIVIGPPIKTVGDMIDRGLTRYPNHRDRFVLHPGEFCLGVTLERVTIPDDLVARLEGRSSVGRLGLAIHVTAGYIDPGFRGPITLEMANLSPHPLILRPGRSICQLSVMRMSSPPTNPYRGRYQDAEGVESSRYGEIFEVDHESGRVEARQGGEEVVVEGEMRISPDDYAYVLKQVLRHDGDTSRSKSRTEVVITDINGKHHVIAVDIWLSWKLVER